MQLDLVIRNGTVVTAADSASATSASSGGRIVALAEAAARPPARSMRSDRLVLPGGVDSHCHIEQLSGMGVWNADDFYSGTVSAAFGGTTTVIPFAAQHRGESMVEVVADYRERARKAVIDHAFHMIVSDPSEQVMSELPGLIKDGYSSLKLFMTYPLLRLDDDQMLDLLALARRERAMVSVHAENDAMIAWMVERLLARGHTAPRYHAVSHPRLAEAEAVGRLIAMAALVDQPVVVFHVTTEGSMARDPRGPDPGPEGVRRDLPAVSVPDRRPTSTSRASRAPNGCSARRRATPPTRTAIWRGIRNGTFQIVSSDHAPYRFDETGKLAAGARPALQADRERHSRHRAAPAAAVLRRRPRPGGSTSTASSSCAAPTRPRSMACTRTKGTIAIGSDADLAIWDPELKVEVEHGTMHDRDRLLPLCRHDALRLAGHRDLARRGDRRWRRRCMAERGRGRFCHARPARRRGPRALAPELDPARNFGAELL